MPRSRYTICSEGLSVDRGTGNLTIFNVIDGISPSSFPIVIPRLIIISNFERGRKDPQVVKLRLLGKLGEATFVDTPVDLDFLDKLRANIVITLQAIPITGPGKLVFSFLDDQKKSLGSYDIIVQSPPKLIITQAGNP